MKMAAGLAFIITSLSFERLVGKSNNHCHDTKLFINPEGKKVKPFFQSQEITSMYFKMLRGNHGKCAQGLTSWLLMKGWPGQLCSFGARTSSPKSAALASGCHNSSLRRKHS